MFEVMAIELIPPHIRDMYEHYEWRHACAIMCQDYPNEWNDFIHLLDWFRLRRSDLTAEGKGNKSAMASNIDGFLYDRGWHEKKFDTAFVVDGNERQSPTHKIDCYKNSIALEIEWNNKDPFFDRDLNNFRLLFDLRVVSVGIIITRSDSLRSGIPKEVGKFGNGNVTHMGALLPRIEGGGGGGCPIIAIGLTPAIYIDNE